MHSQFSLKTTVILAAILLINGLFFLSCDYFTEPAPFLNKDAHGTEGWMTLRDHNTGEIYHDSQHLTEVDTIFDIVPDSVGNQIVIDTVEVDSVALEGNPKDDGTTIWGDWKNRIPFNVIVRNRTILLYSWHGPITGQHFFRLNLRMFYSNAGFELLNIKEQTFTITLLFN